MSGRLHEAQLYKAQGFRPIPIRAGTKALALPKGQRKTYAKAPPSDQELRRWFPAGTRKNIALLLGPALRLLVVNINMKHDQDGWASLNGYSLPPAPTILTPHGGQALLFKPPDRERYPFPFKVHMPHNLPGVELRGTGGYQLVPSSQVDACTQKDGTVDPAGAYRLEESWTLARLILECAELPDWLRDLWITLDRVPRDHPPQPRKPEIVDSSCRSSSSPTVYSPSTTVYNFSREREKVLSLSSPVGSPRGQASLEDGGLTALALDRGAQVSCARVLVECCGLAPVAVASIGRSVRCILPGHHEAHPSVTLHWSDRGELMYHDWHAIDGKPWWNLVEVYAAVVVGAIAVTKDGHVAKMGRSSFAVWRLRLLIEAGVIEPYPVDIVPLPNDAPRYVARVYAGFRLLLACKWAYLPGTATVFTWSFAAGWCGVGIVNAGKAIQWLVRRGVLEPAGQHRRQPLYLPRKE
jgi:hypothetical protein